MAYTSESTKGGGRLIKKLLRLQMITIYLAVAMLGFSTWSWWQYAYSSPNRVFWDMVDNSLSTNSFSKKVVQDDSQQGIVQLTQSQLAPKQLINSQTTIRQAGPPTAEVVTQSLGTPRDDYVRYTKVQTSQKSTTGKDLDFASLLNQWGKSQQQSEATSGQLYNETTLSVIPFGNLTAQQRQKMVKLMKDTNVYTYSLSRKDQKSAGRNSYTYKVDINPQAYIGMLKEYGRMVGLTQLEAVDASQYAQAQPVSVDLTVDGWSHQLTAISFGGGSRVEHITAYGALTKLEGEPSKTIPVEELQAKLQAVQ